VRCPIWWIRVWGEQRKGKKRVSSKGQEGGAPLVAGHAAGSTTGCRWQDMSHEPGCQVLSFRDLNDLLVVSKAFQDACWVAEGISVH